MFAHASSGSDRRCRSSVTPNSQGDFPSENRVTPHKSSFTGFTKKMIKSKKKKKTPCFQLNKAEHPRTEGFIPKTEEEIAQVSDQNQARRQRGVHPD